MPKLTIDGITFHTEDLTDRGRAVLSSLQFVDGQLDRLRREITVLRTARLAYAKALKAEAECSAADAGAAE